MSKKEGIFYGILGGLCFTVVMCYNIFTLNYNNFALSTQLLINTLIPMGIVFLVLPILVLICYWLEVKYANTDTDENE